MKLSLQSEATESSSAHQKLQASESKLVQDAMEQN